MFTTSLKCCQALFSSVREGLITNVDHAPTVTRAQKTILKAVAEIREEKVFRRSLLREYQANEALPNGNEREIKASILISHPTMQALEEARKLFPTAWEDYLLLKMTNVSLVNASRVTKRTIEKEGDAELKKSSAICVPIISEDWSKFLRGEWNRS